ncbi:MAG: alkaline phosphatase family protein [Candidatus Omnitrophota bacterium]
MKIPGSFNKKTIIMLLIFALIVFVSFIVPGNLINKKRTKILIIGLDGAGWRTITPMMSKGKLPNIKRLLEEGVWGKLATLEPALSDIVWTTVATGKSPELHGIVKSFFMRADQYTIRAVKAIWNILSDRKKKVGVVGYRRTWPAEKVNGIMISDVVRINKKGYSSMLDAQPPLNRLCTKMMFDDFDKGAFLATDSFMANIAEYLYKKNTFDFFCLYLFNIDDLSHDYWEYMFSDNRGLPSEEISKYKDVILSYYEWCDSVIGRLLNAGDNNRTVIIISDHGFKNGDLREAPFLFLKVDEFLETAGLRIIRYNSKKVKLANMGLENKQAFIKNIKITGNISADEFNAVREDIKKSLRNIIIKENSKPLLHVVDTQSGFTMEMDISAVQNRIKYHISIGEKTYRILDFLTKCPEVGIHDSQDAVIIMSGKNIRRHVELKNASVYDITPTTLYLLGLPVASDMQGNVLTSAIDPGLLKDSPVRYIDSYED